MNPKQKSFIMVCTGSSCPNPIKLLIPQNLNHFKWAEFRKAKSGYKLHLQLVFNQDCSHYPDKEVMTNANERDWNKLEILVDDKEAMYVFDRGYVDYKHFDSFTDVSFSDSRKLQSFAL